MLRLGMPWQAELSCAVLRSAVLCCAMLCCAVPCCAGGATQCQSADNMSEGKDACISMIICVCILHNTCVSLLMQSMVCHAYQVAYQLHEICAVMDLSIEHTLLT